MRQILTWFVVLLAPLCGHADRVSDLVSRMTLEEKVDLLGGDEFATKSNQRLGIPALKMTDGPLGVRFEKSTAFPSGISMGASFNRDLIYQTAMAMAVETRAHGRDMLLGPCVGISRLPFNGRNFEGMGEDPFLTSELVANYVRALNDGKVVGSVKHFGLNDQENDRMHDNSIADERTIHEIHLVAFERAVAAGVGSVMASYNRLNGSYASENPDLLTRILKQQWGFQGFVVSDWGATHSTIAAALAGLDLEMPNGQYFNEQLVKAVRAGEVPEALIDDKVSRVLRQIERIGLFDGADKIRPGRDTINSSTHQALALQLAQESHVLLKNANGTLPLDLQQVKKIAVVGPNGNVYIAGGGSSMVDPARSISTFNGLRDRVGQRASVQAAPAIVASETTVASAFLTPARGGGHGLYAEYFSNRDLSGAPLFTRVDGEVNFYGDETSAPDMRLKGTDYSVRWTGRLHPMVSGTYQLQTNADDGVRLWIDDRLVINNWQEHAAKLETVSMNLRQGRTYKIRLEYFQATGNATIRLAWAPPAQALRAQAVQLARHADAAIVAVGFNADLEGEGIDRYTFDLPEAQVELIKAVARVNPRTIVVINSGNPVAMGAWMNSVQGLIYAWFPGQEGGYALADILLGNYNPSGRLPITMLKRWEDSPAYGSYPSVDGNSVYQEGIYVGYRHFDKINANPEFEFGYGLSYTSFSYSDLNIQTTNGSAENPTLKVTATITNTGVRAGAEVVQLYVQDLEPKVDRPVQELKGFAKVFLDPGESRTVTFQLDQRSFAFYDVESHSWVARPGQFNIRLGSSSRALRLNGVVALK